ncbi:uncharacterized protein LOC142982678 [Anticarsia gemmatalis]|uniref:uncharacterized protein LOC142982678 n=1 Tax=Anticarsia gemmatalis TaxID=129554 RepID=UPI003F76D8B4
MIPYQSTIFFVLVSPVLSQLALDAIQPDVTFNDDNDRYDVNNIIQDNNKAFRQHQFISQEEYRRDLNTQEELNLGEEFNYGLPARKAHDYDSEPDFSDIKAALTGRRFFDFDGFYHEQTTMRPGDFEENLKPFMNNADRLRYWRRMAGYVDHLHGKQETRRSGGSRRSGDTNDENEVLMHYAVPIAMNIDGFLRVPLQ